MTATWVALIARSRIILNQQYVPCSLYQTCLVCDSTANSLTASKNARLDHCLTYVEYMFAKNHFLMAIENAKWGNEALDTFN